MPLTEEEQQWLNQTLGIGTPVSSAPAVPGTLPPAIAGAAYPSRLTVGSGRNRVGLTIPPPSSETQRQLDITQTKQTMAEDSATRRQLLKKAADQKLQLEQAIGLFDKIYTEAESNIPVIQHPEGTLPLQQLGRFAGQKLGLREKTRGTITSLQARATPALKALGEVGVLTDQDIQRMLKGGFPADDDTDVSRQAKREGMLTDLQRKLDQVNATLGQSGTRQADRPADNPYLAEARRRGLIK